MKVMRRKGKTSRRLNENAWWLNEEDGDDAEEMEDAGGEESGDDAEAAETKTCANGYEISETLGPELYCI